MNQDKQAIEILANELYKESYPDKQGFEERLFDLLPDYRFTYAGDRWILL